MEKFLFLIREDLVERSNMTAERWNNNTRLMLKWAESIAQSGNFLHADPLAYDGTYVGKDYVVSDGPFIEAKESISGYFVIQAENLEQATSIAQTCPLVLNGTAAVEVRPIMLLSER